MKVYVPSGTKTIVIDRSETTSIDTEFDVELMAFHIDETLGIVTIRDISNNEIRNHKGELTVSLNGIILSMFLKLNNSISKKTLNHAK